MQIVFKIYQFSPRNFCFLCNNGRLFRIIKLRIGIVGAFTLVFFFVPKKNTKYNLCSFFTKNLVSQRTAENFFIIKTTILTLERNLLFHAKIRILLMYSWLEVLIQFFQISNSIRIHFRIRVLLRIGEKTNK